MFDSEEKPETRVSCLVDKKVIAKFTLIKRNLSLNFFSKCVYALNDFLTRDFNLANIATENEFNFDILMGRDNSAENSQYPGFGIVIT